MVQASRPLSPNESLRHFFGAELRTWRERRELSQAALGARVLHSGAAIGKVEKAERWPSQGLAARCDEALDAAGALARLWPLVEAERKRTVVRTYADMGRTDADGHRVALVRVATGGNTVIASSTLSEEIAMVAEESARFVRQPRGTVDQDVLDQLSADVTQLARSYLLRPPYLMFEPLARLRRTAFDLLDARQRPAVLPGLYRIAGQLCALLAHASADLGQAYASETHARTAWLCADFAEDDALRAYVRWVQSNMAYWTGDYHAAAELAHIGQAYATHGTSLIRLASQEARAFAALAESNEVEAALALAQNPEAPPADEPASEPGGVFHFGPEKAAYYASETRLSLGGDHNARYAIADAERALTLLDNQPAGERCPEFVAAAQLDLVKAHLALRELDGADTHLRPVLSLPVESRTLPVVRRMTSVDHDLSSTYYAHSSLATDLSEQIACFCAYPAIRELPSSYI
jgi:hypothetical protein